MTTSIIKTYKLSKIYLVLLTLFTLFISLIFALPLSIFTADLFDNLLKNIVSNEEQRFLPAFILQLLVLWVPFFGYFLSKRVILSDSSITFKNIFRQKSILWNDIVDYAVRGYYGSRIEALLGEVIAYFTHKPQTSGTILEIWFKDKNGYLDYTEENITNFSNSKEFLGVIGQKVKIKEHIQHKTRSLSFYIKTHKAYTAIVALGFFSLLAFGIYSILKEDKSFALKYFVRVLPAFVLWFLFVRNFFNRR